jgi:hypothetical protein
MFYSRKQTKGNQIVVFLGPERTWGVHGLTWRRTARRIKRLKEGVLTISPDYSDRDPRLFGALLDRLGARLWRHPIWPKERTDPKPAIDAVISQAQLAKKVAACCIMGNRKSLRQPPSQISAK